LGILIVCVALAAWWGAPARAESPDDAPDEEAAAVAARQAAEEATLLTAARCQMMGEAWQHVTSAAAAAARVSAWVGGNEQEDQPSALSRSGAVALSGRGAASAPAAMPVQTARVPILMYHHIADAPPGADAIRRDLSVSPSDFRRHLDYLQAHGYHTISLADLAAHLQEGAPLPAKPIVLTFDDGYDDNYSNAYPLLRHFGYSGTFFVLTDFVGQAGYAGWEQIAEMSGNGMEIEAHGRTHADLAMSSAADVAWQAAGSRDILREKLGRTTLFYCYPSGRYTAQTVAVLRANGYAAAVTIDYGATHSAAGLFELRRIRIRGADSIEQFAAKVETAP
jgi:peptidoglycan/xylan/chitin deacetylase (PgdA/CDA1 family)